MAPLKGRLDPNTLPGPPWHDNNQVLQEQRGCSARAGWVHGMVGDKF